MKEVLKEDVLRAIRTLARGFGKQHDTSITLAIAAALQGESEDGKSILLPEEMARVVESVLSNENT